MAQLVGLERRTSRGGRDSIDHPPGGHDDLADALAGVAHLLLGKRPAVFESFSLRDVLGASDDYTSRWEHWERRLEREGRA